MVSEVVCIFICGKFYLKKYVFHKIRSNLFWTLSNTFVCLSVREFFVFILFFSSDAEQKNRKEALKWIVSLDFKIINHYALHRPLNIWMFVVYAEEVFDLIFWWEIVFLEWQIIMGRCMRVALTVCQSFSFLIWFNV